MNTNQNLLNGLNTLLTRNYDAEKGYKEAAVGSKNAEFRDWLMELSKMRERFSEEIKYELEGLGGSPDEGSSLLAGMHRTWIDFKTDWINNDIDAIVKEIEFGENRSIEDYDSVLKEQPMPVTTRNLLTRHVKKIRKSLNRLQAFKDIVETVA